jgi:hypothetical protein
MIKNAQGDFEETVVVVSTFDELRQKSDFAHQQLLEVEDLIANTTQKLNDFVALKAERQSKYDKALALFTTAQDLQA